MTRPFNTKHPFRGRSSYRRKGKNVVADFYGDYSEGNQRKADRIAGQHSWKKVDDKK